MIAESHVEEAALAWLKELGYPVTGGPDIGPDGDKPERASYGDVILVDRVKQAIARLNPGLPPEAQADAFRRVMQSETPTLFSENRRLHKNRETMNPVSRAYLGDNGSEKDGLLNNIMGAFCAGKVVFSPTADNQ